MGASLHPTGPRHLHQCSYHPALFYTCANQKPPKRFWRHFVIHTKQNFFNVSLLQTHLDTRWCYCCKPMNSAQIISQNSLPYLTLCCGGTSCPPGMAQEGRTSCPKTQGQERTLEEIGPHSAWNHNHWETKREQEHFLRSTYCLSRLLILKAIWKNLSGIPQALWNYTGWNLVTMWHGDLVKEKWRPTGGVYAKPTNRAKSLTLRCSRLRITL